MFLTLSALTALIFAGRSAVFAVEIAIENNGTGASSEVQVQQTTQTTTQQSNNATVNNDVAVNADTGNNQVSGNNGPAQVTTGDINSDTTVTNNVNQTQVNQPCCEGTSDTIVTVSGNGEGSVNTVWLTTGQTTQVYITQTAKITNEIHGTAITGQNTASDNSGSVTITTGDIKGKVMIVNGVNTADIKVSQTGEADTTVKILGNGSNSVNLITFNNQQMTEVFKYEQADILNRLGFVLITGQNTANDNLGPVSITTGDVTFNAAVVNDPVNQNVIDIGCCPTKPPVIPPPVNPPDIKPYAFENVCIDRFFCFQNFWEYVFGKILFSIYVIENFRLKDIDRSVV